MLNSPEQIPALWKSLTYVLVYDGRIRGGKRQCLPQKEIWVKIIICQRYGNLCPLKCGIKTSNLCQKKIIKGWCDWIF